MIAQPVRLPFAVAVCAFALAACGIFTPATVPAVTALGACIIDRSATDAQVQPTMTALAIVEDVAAYCATDVGVVVATLAEVNRAHAKASAHK
jgi:hypothetical protein